MTGSRLRNCDAHVGTAALALTRNTKLSARHIAEQSMMIAGKICIYTNENVIYEELG